jgi:hypothetical protein
MIIWSGWGFLVAVITFGCALLGEVVTEAAAHDDRYYQNHGWPKLAAFLVAAAIVWPLGRLLNRKQTERELVDPATGQRVLLQSGGGHSLFFVPVQYWAPILVALGVVFLFVK